MKIKTELLKELMSKASVGVGANRLIPITELICISSGGGKITIETTDATNYVYVHGTIEDNDEFYVVSYAEQFVKLVGKLTSEFTELAIENGNFVIKANGSYTMELPLDENGEYIKYPDPIANISVVPPMVGNVSIDTIKSAVQITKPALSDDDSNPALMNYYVGESVFATDGCIVAHFRDTLFSGEARLISEGLMDIISSIPSDKIDVGIADSFILIESDAMVVYGTLSSSTDGYEIDKAEEYIETKFNNMCKVDKNLLISAIDRVALFADKFDNRALRLDFGAMEITVSNMKSGSVESVEYKEKKSKNKKKFEQMEVYINADMLIEQLKAYPGDTVTIEFGTDFAISLVSEYTTQIISLMSV